MEKLIEFDLEEEEFKQYLEGCLAEENIDYEIKIEERWIQKFRNPSHYYQVYCVYVKSDNLDKAEKIIKDFENGTIVTDGIEELENIEDEEDNFIQKFNAKNFVKYTFITFIVIGLLIIVGTKFIH